MKKCAKCNEEKELSQFYYFWRKNRSNYYYHSYCKKCVKNITDEYIHTSKGLQNKRASAKRWSKTDKGKINDAKRRDKNRNMYPEKYKARYMLNNAIRLKKVIKKPCFECGNTDTHGHHEDYLKPLQVVWLCRQHHLIKHNQLHI